MAERRNEYDQPVGFAVDGWAARSLPPRTAIDGRYCRLEPLHMRHAADLYEAYSSAADGRDWTYMSAGPFTASEQYRGWVEHASTLNDPLHHVIINLATGKAVGTLSLMRIDPANGAIEVGHVAYSPRVKRTPAGTEAQFLLMRRAFEELGYRRYEWKCDSLNAASRAAALRYGFQFEGIFRQAVIYKGRSRDTAWFSMLDSEWPAIKRGFEQWLDPRNFDPAGKQHRKLAGLIGEAVAAARRA